MTSSRQLLQDLLEMTGTGAMPTMDGPPMFVAGQRPKHHREQCAYCGGLGKRDKKCVKCGKIRAS
jgi:hypothetical protein